MTKTEVLSREAGEVEEGPHDVNSPKKLLRYLSLKEPFDTDFVLEKGAEADLLDELNENDSNLIYRGMSPVTVFKLIRGDLVEIAPYRYEDVAENEPDEDLQNASYRYDNAIMHGWDSDERYSFLSAVGFKPDGFIVQGTGMEMARRLAGVKDFESSPLNKSQDVSIEGILRPENIQVYCFRFKDGKEFKTLVYKRKAKKN